MLGAWKKPSGFCRRQGNTSLRQRLGDFGIQYTTAGKERGSKKSLSGKILRNTTLNILALVIVCCAIMAAAMQFLANNILLAAGEYLPPAKAG